MKNPKICWKTTSRWNWIIWPTCVMRRASIQETLAGLEEQREFLNKHLLNWVPEFCLDIKDHADTEFYRMVGQLTTGFLQLDSFILDKMIVERKARPVVSKSFRISRERMNEILKGLQTEYHIYGPKHVPDRGMWETDGLIRYEEISAVEEIVTDRQRISLQKR